MNGATTIPAEEFGYGLDVTGLDIGSLGEALRAVVADVMADPARMAAWSADVALAEQNVGINMLRRFMHETVQPVAQPPPGDKRFTDSAWQNNPFLASTLEAYLVRARAALKLVDGSKLPPATKRKARFALQIAADACAPSNVPWVNPAVVKEAYDSGGASLMRGMQQYLDDVRTNNGMPRQVDAASFELGKNIGATPGRVVMRNELIELIAYEPQTSTVDPTPLLFSPPWINKYYIMDLAPGRSFVEWAVRHGNQTFMISYRNPDASMAEYGLDDYLRLGPLAALDAVQRITGAPKVNFAALCLGGTMTVVLLAYLAARGEAHRIGTATLTNTMVDFGEPGDLGVFTDEQTIARLERKMGDAGVLDKSHMATTFHWMRANDLVWSYVVNNWFMGKNPPAFDILAWNADSTHMPAKMHSEYLRACYLHNVLVQPNAFEVLGTPLDVRAIDTPLYVVGAEADHIAPWRSSYRTVQLVGGDDVRYVLSNAGHIAGIVNPPGGGKAMHWAAPRIDKSLDADAWRAAAELHHGSWWNDWIVWMAAHGGEHVVPPDLPSGEPAPGRYVRDETGPPLDVVNTGA